MNGKRIKRSLLKSVVALMSAATIMGAIPHPASALTPEQTSAKSTINMLIGPINNFWASAFKAWGYRYAAPTHVYFYTKATGSPCGVLEIENAEYCSKDGAIYLDIRWLQAELRAWTDHGDPGDFAAGVILAHEWGHRIQDLLGTFDRRTKPTELNADCFAGLFTHWAVNSGILNSHDAQEGLDELWYLGGGDHGTRKQRAHWFLVGYKGYSLAGCNAVFGQV